MTDEQKKEALGKISLQRRDEYIKALSECGPEHTDAHLSMFYCGVLAEKDNQIKALKKEIEQWQV